MRYEIKETRAIHLIQENNNNKNHPLKTIREASFPGDRCSQDEGERDLELMAKLTY